MLADLKRVFAEEIIRNVGFSENGITHAIENIPKGLRSSNSTSLLWF